MKKFVVLLIGALGLTGCGLQTRDQKILNIHPAAQQYVVRFEKISGISIDNLEVVFRPIDGKVIGYCQKSYEESYTDLGFTKVVKEGRLIVLDTNFWDPNDKLESHTHDFDREQVAANREELMFHELGHCILNRAHVNSEQSIMNPYHLDASLYINNYAHYIAELFGMTAYAGEVINDNTYASKYFPEFKDRGDEIQVLSPEELENGDFHETHVIVPDPDQTQSDDPSAETSADNG